MLTVACGNDHLHALIEYPDDLTKVKWLVGFAKRAACEAVKHIRQGEMWSAGGTYKPIRNREHHLNTYDYIRARQGPGTFVWTFKGEEHWIGPDGEIIPH